MENHVNGQIKRYISVQMKSKVKIKKLVNQKQIIAGKKTFNKNIITLDFICANMFFYLTINMILHLIGDEPNSLFFFSKKICN